MASGLAATDLPLARVEHPASGRPTARRRLGPSKIVSLAILIGIGIANLMWVNGWDQSDAGIYWGAALSIREGGSPYLEGDAFGVFRYPAWFAWAWVPLTHLPREVVIPAWSGVQLVATAWLVAPLLKTRTVASLALAALMAPFLLVQSGQGNVQPLLLAGIVLGFRYPALLGFAASIKIAPLAYILVLVAQRRWWGAAVATVVGGALSLTWFLYPILPATTDIGPVSIWPTPVFLVVAGVAGLAGLVIALRAPRWAPIGAAIVTTLALPRLMPVDVTFALPAARPPAMDRREGGHGVRRSNRSG